MAPECVFACRGPAVDEDGGVGAGGGDGFDQMGGGLVGVGGFGVFGEVGGAGGVGVVGVMVVEQGGAAEGGGEGLAL